jgi:type II secretory ATPase GspE/PulE/Tfp pilus assembly ATPase PilB-like protein
MLCRLLLICAGVTSPGLAAMPAQAVELQPGLWEVTSKSERDGVIKQRPTKTDCITPEKAKEASRRTSIELGISRGSESCKVVGTQKTDNGMTWRMQCVGPISGEQTGSYVIHSPQHYTAVANTITTAGRRALTSTLTVEGRRTGECPQ